MLAVKAWIYGKLTAGSALQALLGKSGQIIQYEPEIKTTFPLVIFLKSNENDTLYNDNMPSAVDVKFSIDVYAKADSGMATTTDIGIAICNIMSPLLFDSRSFDLPDPDMLIRHLHMEFSRSLTAADIV